MLSHLATPEFAGMRGCYPLLVNDGTLKDNYFILNARIQAARAINDARKPGALMCVVSYRVY